VHDFLVSSDSGGDIRSGEFVSIAVLLVQSECLLLVDITFDDMLFASWGSMMAGWYARGI
jgi:hypothetical protein